MYKISAMLVLSLFLVMASTGCTAKHDKVKTNNYKTQSTTDKRMLMKETHPQQKQHPRASANMTTAEKIAKHVSKVHGVDRATVILNNRDAVVGVAVKKGVHTEMVKRQVKQTVERAEPGYAVHVTTDGQLFSRIKSLQNQMLPMDGHPVRNFSEDVGTLIRDMGRTITAPLR
ncbi:YhcN/YlaJ family sporulation lipoprotein [Paenibacillus sepulcri]|uniref:YhcN/YlaJ family sporulation lipoprotein n=1 Tax=Paenibacillus sepulcri TaxID=359917 RepID=A0ABS7BXV6_9BACL|nr:YhcN/YlaJ family sporulation lipoprotein [Paenibacillus sepulcri]